MALEEVEFVGSEHPLLSMYALEEATIRATRVNNLLQEFEVRRLRHEHPLRPHWGECRIARRFANLALQNATRYYNSKFIKSILYLTLYLQSCVMLIHNIIVFENFCLLGTLCTIKILLIFVLLR